MRASLLFIALCCIGTIYAQASEPVEVTEGGARVGFKPWKLPVRRRCGGPRWVPTTEAPIAVTVDGGCKAASTPESGIDVIVPTGAASTVDAGEAATTVDAGEAASTVDAGEAASTVDAGEAASTIDAGGAVTTAATETATGRRPFFPFRRGPFGRRGFRGSPFGRNPFRRNRSGRDRFGRRGPFGARSFRRDSRFGRSPFRRPFDGRRRS